MFARWTFKVALTAVIVAFAVLTGALRDEPVAHAQDDDRDYVDVGLTLEAPVDISASHVHDLNIIVVNHGSRTAYDVEVVVNVKAINPKQSQSRFRIAPLPSEVPVGRASLDGTSLRWTIPALGGLQREVLPARVTHETVQPQTPIYDNSELVHELFGAVTTASFESVPHKENNTSRIWSYNMASSKDRFIQVGVNYTVDVSVDNRFPNPGDTVNFTVTASRKQTHGSVGSPTFVPAIPPPIDLKVCIELTDGLDDTGSTPTFGTIHTTSDTTFASVSEEYRAVDDDDKCPDGAADVFDIGTGPARSARRAHFMKLPLTAVAVMGAVVNERCLTATLTGNPPPGNGHLDDKQADNVAKLCLGEPPDRKVVFNSGETGLLTWYNCVGRTTYPCSTADSVEIVALGGSAAIDAGLPYEVFKPDKVVIQVPDPLGRATSSEDGSSDLVWSTGYDTGVVMRPGVILTEEMVSLDPSQWGVDVDEDDSRVATLNMDVSGPGKMATWADDDDNDPPYEWFGSATNGALTSGTWYVDPGSYPWYAEFSKLGTYRVDFGGAMAANGGTPVDTDDDTSYIIAKRTYLFHVGPIADLEVGDAGACLAGSSGQRAYTVTAVNNGPDAATAVTVTVLPTSVVQAIATQGSYTNGVWTIGEMHGKAQRSHSGHSENATLTLITEDAADTEITATIENTQDYEVCIGSDGSDIEAANETACTSNTGVWHTTKYYDYDASNNTATIKART